MGEGVSLAVVSATGRWSVIHGPHPYYEPISRRNYNWTDIGPAGARRLLEFSHFQFPRHYCGGFHHTRRGGGGDLAGQGLRPNDGHTGGIRRGHSGWRSDRGAAHEIQNQWVVEWHSRHDRALLGQPPYHGQ